MDRRVAKTRKHIVAAFFELLKKKALKKSQSKILLTRRTSTAALYICTLQTNMPSWTTASTAM